MNEITRRRFIRYGSGAPSGLVLCGFGPNRPGGGSADPGGTLDSTTIPQAAGETGDPARDDQIDV
jgi:hypothetical protein